MGSILSCKSDDEQNNIKCFLQNSKKINYGFCCFNCFYSSTENSLEINDDSYNQPNISEIEHDKKIMNINIEKKKINIIDNFI